MNTTHPSFFSANLIKLKKRQTEVGLPLIYLLIIMNQQIHMDSLMLLQLPQMLHFHQEY